MMSKDEQDYFYNVSKHINKTILLDLVKQRLPQIKKTHISSIINILFDQLEEDLIKDKKIIIGNFIEFNLKTMPHKRARSYYTGEIIITKPFNKLKLILGKKFTRKLIKYLDVDTYLSDK